MLVCVCIKFCTDLGPTSGNIESFCSVVLDRSAIAYDITFHLLLDETFTPAVISAIDFLRAASFQIGSDGNTILGTTTNRRVPLESNVTQGPVALGILFDNFPQRAHGIGYFLDVSTLHTNLILHDNYCCSIPSARCLNICTCMAHMQDACISRICT